MKNTYPNREPNDKYRRITMPWDWHLWYEENRLIPQQEAQAAAKVANLPIPMEKGEYTLAELFNQGYRATVRKAGFGFRH